MHKEEDVHETADPVQDFIDWLKKKMHFKVDKKKLLKRVSIFIVLFSLFNVWLYNIEYKRYVSQAPKQFVKAREDLVKALMFHMYYTFLVKTVRIDFQNPLLYPLKAPRDFYYHQGINKLPLTEGERAYWFDMFEVRLYNYSVSAKYGSLAQHYSSEFSHKFIDDVYHNLELLSLHKITDKSLYSMDNMLEVYIDLMSIFVFDSHLNPKGYIFSVKNLNNVSSNKKLHNRYLNLYEWQESFLSKYKHEHREQYNQALNPSRGWYSAYRNHNESLFFMSSWILFYKVKNKEFDCDADLIFFNSAEESKQKLLKLLEFYPKDSKQKSVLQREINYLYIPNMEENLSIYQVNNPLGLSVNCKYEEQR